MALDIQLPEATTRYINFLLHMGHRRTCQAGLGLLELIREAVWSNEMLIGQPTDRTHIHNDDLVKYWLDERPYLSIIENVTEDVSVHDTTPPDERSVPVKITIMGGFQLPKNTRFQTARMPWRQEMGIIGSK